MPAIQHPGEACLAALAGIQPPHRVRVRWSPGAEILHCSARRRILLERRRCAPLDAWLDRFASATGITVDELSASIHPAAPSQVDIPELDAEIIRGLQASCHAEHPQAEFPLRLFVRIAGGPGGKVRLETAGLHDAAWRRLDDGAVAAVLPPIGRWVRTLSGALPEIAEALFRIDVPAPTAHQLASFASTVGASAVRPASSKENAA